MNNSITKVLLKELEEAVRRRNPILAERLRPGLSEPRIREMLKRAKVHGTVEPIVNLFAWKNGTDLDSNITQGDASPFPESVFMFVELRVMIADFIGFRELSLYHRSYIKLVDRFFPVFWDGSTGWLAVDLKSSQRGRVVIIDPESGNTPRQAYSSFNRFLEDAIRANEKNQNLSCF